jgi:hypothetical protein
VADFPLFIGTDPATSGVAYGLNSGSYVASETEQFGYSASNWGGDCDAAGNVTLSVGENKTCTITNRDIAPKLTLVKTVTNDDGGALDVADFPLFIGTDSATSGVVYGLYAGSYVASETEQFGYSASDWGGDCDAAGNVTLSVGESKTCTITNDDIAPTLKLVKIVDNGANPGGTAVPDDWTLYAAAATPLPFPEADDRDFSNLGDSGSFQTVFANVGYDLSESTVAGYQVKTDWSCVDEQQNPVAVTGGAVTLGLDQDVTCTIENEALGMVDLLKLTQGQLYPHEAWSTMTWNFTLKGPGGFDESASAPPSELDFGGAYLIPGEEYTLCETGIPSGWTLEWKGDGGDGGAPDTIIPIVANVNYDPVDGSLGYSRVFDPNYVENQQTSNDERCVNFVVEVGQTKQFSIDNQYPGGEPRTIGFWKNWNTCTGGNQHLTAAANGGPDAGWYILDDLLNDPGYTIGTLLLEGDMCEEAVDILDKRSIDDGKKRASDGAYNLASQLLAAQLNLSAGAETCQAVVDAVNDGQTLLAGIGFDGTGSYLKGKKAGEANGLAAILDEYNNGNLCTP